MPGGTGLGETQKMMEQDEGVHKPDPRALLSEIEREEGKKGKLKIFLGYAAGVGKTYKMLEQAREMKHDGVNVVVGVVETHGRLETEALLEGLTVVPCRSVPYGNIILHEMDLDAILKLHPDVVLVDELAHTNAPESRHVKRYQDVEELIENNMDVYTTVNVQHFESVNDVVTQVTGIRVKETVPDLLLDKADDIDIVDITIEELLERLKEGKVYISDQAEVAVQRFFKRGNLLALRQLALRRAASKLDDELKNYMKAHAIVGPWPTADRLIVCIGPTPYARQLVRKAYQMAAEANAEWFAVYVETVSLMRLAERARVYVTNALKLAEELGGKVRMLTGTDAATELIRFAQQERVTKVLIGKPRGSLLLRILRRSPAYKILQNLTSVDVYFITPTPEQYPAAPLKPVRIAPPSIEWKGYYFSFLVLIGVTLTAFLIDALIHLESLVMIFLIAPITSAIFFGIGPSIFVSLASIAVYDFFFVMPRFSLVIGRPEYALDLLIFFITAVATGQLAKLARRQQEALQVRLEHVRLLEEMSRELLMLPSVEQLLNMEVIVQLKEELRGPMQIIKTTLLDHIAGITARYIQNALGTSNVVMFSDEKGVLKVWARSDADVSITANEHAIATWVYLHGQPAGRGTRTLSGSRFFFLPMHVKEQVMGVIGLTEDYGSLLPNEQYIAGAIANLAAEVAKKFELSRESAQSSLT